MITKTTVKLKKTNVLFGSGDAAYDDKRSLYSEEAKESINENYKLLQDLGVFVAPIQLEWDQETSTLSVHKFVESDRLGKFWEIHQLISAITDNQPKNDWEFIDLVITDDVTL
jgi:hypothetical protein